MALALDWYFKIDDVHGDAVGNHQTWIEVYSWNLRSVGHGIGVGRGRLKELSLVMVTGTARARLISAMQTGQTFMKAQLHGVSKGMTVEGNEWVHLRVVNVKPGGRNRNMQLLEEVTFETDVLPNN